MVVVPFCLPLQWRASTQSEASKYNCRDCIGGRLTLAIACTWQLWINAAFEPVPRCECLITSFWGLLKLQVCLVCVCFNVYMCAVHDCTWGLTSPLNRNVHFSISVLVFLGLSFESHINSEFALLTRWRLSNSMDCHEILGSILWISKYTFNSEQIALITVLLMICVDIL